MGHDRFTTSSHIGGRLRTLASARAAAFHCRTWRRRATTATLHPLPRNRFTGGCRYEPAVGPDLARCQARDEDTARCARRTPHVALGRRPVGACGAVSPFPLRRRSYPHSRGGALDLRLWRVLRRALFRS